MKTLVYDSVSTGSSHLSFNTTIINSLIVSNSINYIDVFLDKEQGCIISENITSKKVNFIKGFSNARNNKYSFLRKIKNHFILIKTVKKNKPDVIFVLASDNFLTPFSLFLCKKIYMSLIYIYKSCVSLSQIVRVSLISLSHKS